LPEEFIYVPFGQESSVGATYVPCLITLLIGSVVISLDVSVREVSLLFLYVTSKVRVRTPFTPSVCTLVEPLASELSLSISV
jgi:hypothetical protein